MKIINTWNTNGKVAVKFETKNGTSVKEHNCEWYFGILRSDRKRAEELMQKNGIRYLAEDRSEYPDYTRIYCQSRYGQDRYRVVRGLENNGIQTFEGDLKLDKRWCLDHDYEISDKLSKLYFDIETDDRGLLRLGQDMILSFSAIDDAGQEFYYVVDDETSESEIKLLSTFIELITNYDIILGWNSRDFDIPYLKSRMKKYNIDDSAFNRIAKYDLLRRFRHIFRFDSQIRRFSLNYISQHFLNKGKVQFKTSVYTLWKDNREKLKEYNLEDSKLIKELDEKLKVSEMMIRQSVWCKVPPSKFGLYSIIDSYILRKAHQTGKMGKTSTTAIKEMQYNNEQGNEDGDDTSRQKEKNKREDTDREKKYTGALVLDPIIGKYPNVYSFDFKSLYPSIIRTSNIGYDTLRNVKNDNYITNPGTYTIPRMSGHITPTYFDKSPSVVASAVTDLLSKRTEYKDLKLKMIEEGKNHGSNWETIVSNEIIVKELSNSTYGIMGLEYGRYFSIDVAESITLMGQWCILFAKQFFLDQGYKVIYGDTDSVFIVGKIVNIDVLLEKFHIELRRHLKRYYNIDDCYIQLNFDKYYEHFLLITKKTYVGQVRNIEGKKTNELYARGLDFLKKNAFSFAKEKQKDLVVLLLNKDYTDKQIYDWYWATKKEFESTVFTKEELTITQRVNKREYKILPLHARLAKEHFEKTGEYLRGGEVDYIVTEAINNQQGVLADDWDGKEYSKVFYWYDKTVPLLERVIRPIYPNLDFNDVCPLPSIQKKLKHQLTLF